MEELNRILDFLLSFFFVYLHIGLNSFSLHTRDGKWENFSIFHVSAAAAVADESFSLVIVRICDPHEGIQIFSYPISSARFSHNSISAA